MKVYFVTRFSIYDPSFKGFRLSRNRDRRDYERRLFSKARLEHKFEVFEAITLPSIVAQSNHDWQWLIYSSDRLPEEYATRLAALVRNHANITVIHVSSFAEFFEKDMCYDYEDLYATVRLDDDDGLNSCFVETLQGYSGYAGSIVSFTEGRRAKVSKGRVIVGEKLSERNCALGLSGIGLKIYRCGRHSDLHTRYNVIYDATPNMYLLGCSPFTDTERGFTPQGRLMVKCRRILWLLLTHPHEVPKEFGGIRDRLRHARQ